LTSGATPERPSPKPTGVRSVSLVLDKVVFELKNDKGQAAMKKQAHGAAEVFAGAL
jgi:hypothetical protein